MRATAFLLSVSRRCRTSRLVFGASSCCRWTSRSRHAMASSHRARWTLMPSFRSKRILAFARLAVSVAGRCLRDARLSVVSRGRLPHTVFAIPAHSAGHPTNQIWPTLWCFFFQGTSGHRRPTPSPCSKRRMTTLPLPRAQNGACPLLWPWLPETRTARRASRVARGAWRVARPRVRSRCMFLFPVFCYVLPAHHRLRMLSPWFSRAHSCLLTLPRPHAPPPSSSGAAPAPSCSPSLPRSPPSVYSPSSGSISIAIIASCDVPSPRSCAPARARLR